MTECIHEFIKKIKYFFKKYSEYERHSMDIVSHGYKMNSFHE